MTDKTAELAAQGPERIFLAPACCTDPNEGRIWCEHDVWPLDDCPETAPGIAYVRADLADRPKPAVPADGLREAAQGLLARMSDTYTARNGRRVGIQGDDGEKCWIVHSDDIEDLRRAALIEAPRSCCEAEREPVAWIQPDWKNPANFTGYSPVTTYPRKDWLPLYLAKAIRGAD